MSSKSASSAGRLRLHSVEAPARLGGETRPYEYPHLYQIQAGDWRISYAVEQNRLAILVLEVLNPDGTLAEDPVRETLTRKMKVKLLDWPEGSPSRDLRPEDLGRKVKIRLLDLVEDAVPDGPAATVATPRVKLAAPMPRKSRPSVVLDAPRDSPQSPTDAKDGGRATETSERKVTPLDSPSM